MFPSGFPSTTALGLHGFPRRRSGEGMQSPMPCSSRFWLLAEGLRPECDNVNVCIRMTVITNAFQFFLSPSLSHRFLVIPLRTQRYMLAYLVFALVC